LRILVLNSGSSSLKAALYELDRTSASQLPAPPPVFKQNADSVDSVLQLAGHVDAVGHRVVHGGPRFREATIITPEVRQTLIELAEIAPVHAPREVEIADAASKALSAKVPQIAVFDTAFHATLAPAAYTYGGPYSWPEQGIRRYGFHGLSYQYSSRRAAQLLGEAASRRLLICHLGSGASLCAIREGKSVDTTMGFTPLEGLVMATRSGSIDPGIALYLERHKHYSADDIDRILNHESGLAGLTGTSGDMREVLSARERGDARATLAFDVYMHRLVRESGAMIAVMGGVDAIVFTGGVGENSAQVRDELRRRLSFLGNVPTLIIAAEEEWEIARECVRLLER
jgi:acetate kinase